MFPRFSRFVLCALLSLFAFRAEAYLQELSPQSFNALYELAVKGNISAINNARSRGLNIDSVNANGDTGLCVAAKSRNKRAFKAFLQSGANPYHPCTWEVKGYQDFMKSVIANPVKNMDTAVAANKSALTGMSFTTKALIGAGVVAAGAGTAVALGGGGGGGGDKVVTCINGHWEDGACVCNDGYEVFYEGNCYAPLACDHGVQKGGKCACDVGYNDGNLCENCGPGYGRDSTGVCRLLSADVYGNPLNTNYNYLSTIDINNNTYANVYGLFYDAGETIHWHYLEQDKFANTYISVEAEDVEIDTGETDTDGNPIMETVAYCPLNETHSINITNHSDGNVYGLYSNNASTIYNNHVVIAEKGIVALGTSEAQRTQPGVSKAYITIDNTGDGNVFGIWGNGDIISGDYDEKKADPDSDARMTSVITVTDNGAGNAFGIYNYSNTGSISNVYSEGTYFTLNSTITVDNTGTGSACGTYVNKGTINNSGLISVTSVSGNAFGAYTTGGTINNVKIYNEDEPSHAVFVTSTSGDACGIYAHGGTVNNGRWVSATSTDGNAIGIYLNSTANSTTNTVNNSSKITATSTNGKAYGIYNIGGKVINSTQRYPIDVKTTSGTAIGIYSDGGSVENTGRIWVQGPSETSYGIYATNGATVKNSGQFEFVINGDELKYTSPNACTGDITSTCYTSSGEKAIYLTGNATLLNAGSISSNANVNVGTQGVILTLGGQFSAPSLTGNLAVSNEVVSSDFLNQYVLYGAIDAEDTSALILSSESALFDAHLTGKDVVLTKKDFATVLENNASVAAFLEKNYALQNNESLYTSLKEQSSLQALNNVVKQLTGQEVLSRFITEDLLMDKELGFDVNEKMTASNEDVFSFSGTLAPQIFSNGVAKSNYALSGTQIGKTKLGVGMFISDVHSDDGKRQNSRVSKNFQWMMPIQKRSGDLRFTVTPKMGYAYGTYHRTGYTGKDYEGKIEKRMAAVANQARYSIHVGQFEIAPVLDANFAVYQTKLKENENVYSLSASRSEAYSVETGFGAYLSTEQALSKTKKLQFSAGALLYHEFADPNELTLSMNGMEGHFKITDDKRSKDYVVLRSKISFDFGQASVYGGFLSYVDKECRARADIGLKYAF